MRISAKEPAINGLFYRIRAIKLASSNEIAKANAAGVLAYQPKICRVWRFAKKTGLWRVVLFCLPFSYFSSGCHDVSYCYVRDMWPSGALSDWSNWLLSSSLALPWYAAKFHSSIHAQRYCVHKLDIPDNYVDFSFEVSVQINHVSACEKMLN